MDLSLAPKQPCQMKSQREFCKSELLPLFSLLLSFTELAIFFYRTCYFTELAESPEHPDYSFVFFASFFYRTCYFLLQNLLSLPSTSSRGATQTFEEYKAWPGLDILATLGKYMAWPAYPAQASSRHWRNTGPRQTHVY